MGDLIVELIKRFGPGVIIVLIVVLIVIGGLVWFVTHSSAKPGERVSIFWGMIEYVKGEKQPKLELDPQPKDEQKFGSGSKPKSEREKETKLELDPQPKDEQKFEPESRPKSEREKETKPKEKTEPPIILTSPKSELEFEPREKAMLAKKAELEEKREYVLAPKLKEETKLEEKREFAARILKEEAAPILKEEIGPTGKIVSPPSGSQVSRWFQVRGTSPGQYRHLWLIVRVGKLYWPKEPRIVPQDGQWIGEVYEGGQPPNGRFEVLLVDVSNNVDRRFQKWLENGHRTGHYPGFTREDLEDVNILDIKEYRLIMK